MFQYYWPAEDACEECNDTSSGATLHVSEEPIYFVCARCNPQARKDALKYATNLAEEEYVNGWEWTNNKNSQQSSENA